MEYKYVCSRCFEVKPRSAFYEKTKFGKRPVTSRCRSCTSGDSFLKKFEKHGTICSTCGLPRELISKTECRLCLAKAGLRRCKKCKEIKLYALNFYAKKSNCIDCMKEASSGFTKRSVRALESRRDPTTDLQIKSLNRYLIRMYGITWDQYNEISIRQEGRCQICGEIPTDHRLCVDHDHNTGTIRSLLCKQCNLGIGSFKEDPLLLQAAIDYIQRWK